MRMKKVCVWSIRNSKRDTRNSYKVLWLFCFDALDVQMDLHLVSDDQSTGIEGFIPHHAEIFAIQFTVGGESGSRISPGVFRDAVQRASEGHFFGHTVECEKTDDLVTLSVLLRGFHRVADCRKLFCVHEIGIA